MSLRLMKERIKQSGTTLYDEQIKDAQDILAYGFQDDVSYNPNIVVYKTDDKVQIKMHNQKASSSYGVVTSFLSPHDVPIEIGNMFYDTKKDEYWLCVESYDVSGIHWEGKLAKCLRWLKWQDSKGIIQEIPIIVTSASKYNNGQDSSNTITLGSDQLLIFMQKNDDTLKLDRGYKFFIDDNLDDPTVYELTRIDTALYTYMGKGFLSMIVTECAYTPSDNDLKYGVCNYKEVDIDTEEDPTTTPENPDEMTVLRATITFKGSQELKIGGTTKTLTGSFVDSDGNATADIGVWEVITIDELLPYLKYTITDNTLKIKVLDTDLIDSKARIMFSSADNTISTYLDFDVVSMF